MKLLIVDDHEINLRLLRAQLEAEGHEVMQAPDGVEALQILASQPFDGVISDILMPRMDGYRLCLEVRRNEHYGHIPFVLYTSTYNSPADRMLAESAGADAYISKPAPTETILRALRAAAGKTRHRASAEAPVDVGMPVLKEYNESLVRKLEEKSLELERTFDGLVQVEARLSSLVETAMDGIIAVDESQRIILFNAAATRMFGCSREDAIDQPLNKFIPESARDAHTEQVKLFAVADESTRRMGSRQVYGLRADGTEFPVEASISQLETSQGRLFTVFLRDVTERLRAETKIKRLNRVYAVLSGINSLIVRASSRDELFREACRIGVEVGEFSKAWIGVLEEGHAGVRILAWHGAQDTLQDAALAKSEDEDLMVRSDFRKAVIDGQPIVMNGANASDTARLAQGDSHSEAVLPLRINGSTVGLLSLQAPARDFFDEGELKLLLELARDISFALEHLNSMERIRYLASHDVLTGLPNERQFSEHVADCLETMNHDSGMLAIVFMDLERFRHVNETIGRANGDEILRLVAARLHMVVPSVARIGADCFAFRVTDRHSVSDVARLMEEIASGCFAEPFHVAGQELRIGCRGGISIYPSDGGDAESLLKNAEAALRRAKAASSHCVFYAPHMNAQAAEALAMESRLRRAIERQEFILHYQPKINFSDRRICGVEALLRWQDPDNGLIPPMKFIPVLEEAGLIGAVGRWALGQAMSDQKKWRASGLPTLRVAVNVSPMQLNEIDFVAQIVDIVADDDSNALELEITESVIMANVDRNVAMLESIRRQGVSIAIDDFGTGYSSLAYIAKLPITSLKIDRSFITDMTEGPQGLVMVSSIIALAHALKLKVVAEGVETEEQAKILQLLACDEAQGYLFSRPVSADEIEAMLKAGARLPREAPG